MSAFSHKVFSIPVDILVALVAAILQFMLKNILTDFYSHSLAWFRSEIRSAREVILTIRLSQVGLGNFARDPIHVITFQKINSNSF